MSSMKWTRASDALEPIKHPGSASAHNSHFIMARSVPAGGRFSAQHSLRFSRCRFSSALLLTLESRSRISGAREWKIRFATEVSPSLLSALITVADTKPNQISSNDSQNERPLHHFMMPFILIKYVCAKRDRIRY